MTIDTTFLPTLTQFDIEHAAQVCLRVFCCVISSLTYYRHPVVDPGSLRAAIAFDIA